MNRKVFLISLISVVISFVGGFILANALNRSELSSLRGENERLKSVQNPVNEDRPDTLSDEEIKRKIAEADQNPNDLAVQKNLGTALYKYASFKQNTDLLKESLRLLNRFYAANPQDAEILTTLGNVYFDIGYFGKDNESMLRARDFYQKALEKNQNETNVRTDYALTFYLSEPTENDRAIAELQKALKSDGKNERAMEFLIQAYLAQKNAAEAGKILAKLKQTNADNPNLPQLAGKIAEAANTPEKR